MFGFLKGFLARRRTQAAESEAREAARVAAIAASHREGLLAYVAQHQVQPPKPKVSASVETQTRYSVKSRASSIGQGSGNGTLYSTSCRAAKQRPLVNGDDWRYSISASLPRDLPLSRGRLADYAETVLKPKRTFVEKLHDYLRECKVSHVQVYRAAQIDRRLFSKIISNRQYQPSRDVAIALGIALELSVTHLKDLLERAGYALSKSSRRDLLIEYFVGAKVYDLKVINCALHELNEPLL